MNVQYTARRAALTPEIRAYCEKRLARLKDLVDAVLDVNIILRPATRPRSTSGPKASAMSSSKRLRI